MQSSNFNSNCYPNKTIIVVCNDFSWFALGLAIEISDK